MDSLLIIGTAARDRGGGDVARESKGSEGQLDASTRLTGTTRTFPVSGEFE